jgi:hypothetical protein
MTEQLISLASAIEVVRKVNNEAFENRHKRGEIYRYITGGEVESALLELPIQYGTD